MGGHVDPRNATRGCGKASGGNASSRGGGGASSSGTERGGGGDGNVAGRSTDPAAGGNSAANPSTAHDRNDQSGRNGRNQNLFHPALIYNRGFRALLLSVSVTIILRLLEDLLFPNLYQAPMGAGEGPSGADDPYCVGRYTDVGHRNNHRDDDLEDHVLALLCDWSWVAIISPFPFYIFLRSRGRVCELSASTGRFIRPSSSGRPRARNSHGNSQREVGGEGHGDGNAVEEDDVGDEALLGMRRGWFGWGWPPFLGRWNRAVRSVALWFLRPAALQPLTVCSTPEETAVLAMLCLMDDEEGRRRMKKVGGSKDGIDDDGGEKKTSRGQVNSQRRGVSERELPGGSDTVLSSPDDVERHLRSLMSSSMSSQATSSLSFPSDDDEPLCWSIPGTTSELRPLAVFLIAASAVFRCYSICDLADRSRYRHPPPPPSARTEDGAGGAGFLGLVGDLILHYSETRLRGLRRLVVGPGLGPYGLTRNPMAVSSVTSAIGFLLASPSPVGFVALPVLMYATFRQVLREEGELLCLYGEAYRIYRRRVPRFLGLTERLEELILTTTPQGSTLPSHESWAGDVARSFLLAVAAISWLVLFWDYGGLSQLPRLLLPSWAGVGARARARGGGTVMSFPSFVRDGADSLFASRLRAMDLMTTNDDDERERTADDEGGPDRRDDASDGDEDPSNRGAVPSLSEEVPASSVDFSSSLRSRRETLASRIALARSSLAADCMRLSVGESCEG